MINPLSNQTSALQGNKSDSAVAGKEDFLKLLVTQLQHQDPLSPQDPTEFTSQLAQFSSLEQMFNVNASLAGMTDSLDSLGQVGALSMLGHEVISDSGHITYNGEPLDVGYNLPANVDSVVVNIIDENNHVVASIQGQNVSPGEHFQTWDGLRSDGSIAPNGNYTLSVRAMVDGDTQVAAPALARGRVTAVDFSSQTPSLSTSFGDTPLTTLVRAYEGE